MTCCPTRGSPPPAQLAAACVPFFSKMSVWEQTESERVFNLPISHVPPCNRSCVVFLYVSVLSII